MKVTQIGKYYEVRAEEGYTLVGDGTQGEIRVLPNSLGINKLKEVAKVETLEAIIEESSNDNTFLDSMKNVKIEELKEQCNKVINEGFYSSCYQDAEKLYGCEQEDQINIQSLHQMALSKESTETKLSMGISLTIVEGNIKDNALLYKAKGEAYYSEYTINEVKTLMYDMSNHITSNLTKFNDLKVKVLKATTEEEIYSVEF